MSTENAFGFIQLAGQEPTELADCALAEVVGGAASFTSPPLTGLLLARRAPLVGVGPEPDGVIPQKALDLSGGLTAPELDLVAVQRGIMGFGINPIRI